MNKRIFFIGPKSRPITGQSNCYQALNEYFGESQFFYLHESTRLILREIHSYYREYISKRPSVVYLSFSRSLKGFLRDFLFLLPCFITSPRLIFHLHGSDFETFVQNLPFPISWIYKRVLKKVDTLIVLTDSMIENNSFILDLNPKIKLKTIPNFYPRSFDDLSKSECLDYSKGRELRLLYFSNILYSKGIIDLIFAVTRCVEELGLNLSLSIAGNFMADAYIDGEVMESYFSDLIKDKSYIQYIGVVSDVSDKTEIFRKSDVIVLPTYYTVEAFPLTLIEGMATGNAIISTKHNGLDGVFPKKSGIFVRPKMTRELEDALCSFANNYEKLLEVKKFNFDHSRNNLGIKNHIRQISEILEGD